MFDTPVVDPEKQGFLQKEAPNAQDEIVNTKTSVGGKQNNIQTEETLKIKTLTEEQSDKLIRLSNTISNGADVFLFAEYTYLFIFVIIFGVFIYLYAEAKPGYAFTTIAFSTGAVTSILSGYIGMKIATKANARTCFRA